MSNDLPWFRLDPDKADYRAEEGAYVAGITLLLLPERDPGFRSCVVTGLMTCGGDTAEEAKASAEQQAERYRGSSKQDIDRQISRKTLLSWKLD